MAARSRFSLESVVSMVDRVSRPLGKAGKSVVGFSRKMRGQFRAADASVMRMNKGINRVGAPIAKLATTGLAVGIALAAREFVRFDDAIFGATARFKAAEKPGTDMTTVMKNLRAAARKTGAETKFTAAQMADGLNKFALAGFNSQEAIGVLRSQVDIAIVTGEDFMRVADISSDLLGSFGFSALKGAARIEKLKEMNALLAVGTLSANVTMEDLFETLKKSAPIASLAGAKMEDLIATVSVLGSAGIKSGDAATAMKNIFLRLVSPIGEVKKGFKALGLNQQNFIVQTGKNKGKLKDITKIFDVLGIKMKTMKGVEAAAVFKNLFGMRGIAGGAIIGKNINQIREQLLRMGKDPQKVMKETSEFMQKSLGNRLLALGSAAVEFSFKFFEAFAGKGKDGITRLTQAILKFDAKPMVEMLKTAGNVLSFLWNIINPFLPFLLAFVIVIKAVTIAFAAYNLVTAITASITSLAVLPLIAMVAVATLIIGLFIMLVAKTGGIGKAFIWLIKFALSPVLFFFRGILHVIEGVIGAMAVISGSKALQNAAKSVASFRKKAEFDLSFRPGAAGESKTIVAPAAAMRPGISNQQAGGNGRLDVNFNGAPKETIFKQSGIISKMVALNTGTQ